MNELKTIDGVPGHWGANRVVGSGSSLGPDPSPYQKHAAVHVKLPVELHRSLRARAFELNVTMQLVFESCARAFIDGDEHVIDLVKELSKRRQ